MKHTDIKDLFASSDKYSNGSVTVCGWVRTARESKSISFIELNDGTSLRNIQLVIDKENAKTVYALPSVGTALKITGNFVPSERNGYEIAVTDMEVLGECPADYPLQKKFHTLEYLRTIPHLRPRTRFFEAVFAVRNELSFAIHKYFHSHGYKYMHTPILTGSDCEGAGEMFRVTTQPWNAN